MARWKPARALASDTPTPRGSLIVAGLVSVIVSTFVPFGTQLLYPFTLLVTWVHEMGHGLTAMMLGGRFVKLGIFADAGGIAYTTYGSPFVGGAVALGGLAAPPLVGAVVFALARGPRRATIVLYVFVAALLVSLLVWVRSAVGLVAVPGLAALLFVVARWGSQWMRIVFVQFVGLRLALDTLTRGLDYTFSDRAMVDGAQHVSDIAKVAQLWGGPRSMWSLIVGGASLALIVIGVAAAWRKSR